MVKWNISGDWELMQSNGLIVKMTLVHHLDGTVEGCGESISATAATDTDVRLPRERVNSDLFPIIGSVTHDEVYLEELQRRFGKDTGQRSMSRAERSAA